MAVTLAKRVNREIVLRDGTTIDDPVKTVERAGTYFEKLDALNFKNDVDVMVVEDETAIAHAKKTHKDNAAAYLKRKQQVAGEWTQRIKDDEAREKKKAAARG